MNSHDKLIKEFGILSDAGIGVIMIPTREPDRVLAALMEFTFSRGREYREWDCVKGWATYRPEEIDKPILKTAKDPSQGAIMIEEQTDWGNGVYVMCYPHQHLEKSPVMKQIIKDYSLQFAENSKRLVLIVPIEFIVPSDLEVDITVLDFDPPTKEELIVEYHSIIDKVCEQAECDQPYNKTQVSRIVRAGSGITAKEFRDAIARTVIQHKTLFPDIPIDDFVRSVMVAKTDAVKRTDILEVMKPVDMSEVGGLDLLKKWVEHRKICFAKPEEIRKAGIFFPKGCALLGPPGTGKSLAAKAIGSVFDITVIVFHISRVFSKYVGESEGKIRAALKMLPAMSPCVVFIDEIDKAGLSPTGGSDGGVSNKVLGSILTFMQENDEPIFWVFSGNRIQGVPSELLRKGRLDEVFSVTIPNKKEREEILKIHLRKRKQDVDTIKDLKVAVEASDKFVGSEIESAVNDACLTAFQSGKPVTGTTIANELVDIKPISEAFKADFEEMQHWAEQNAKPSSSKQKHVPHKRVSPHRSGRIDLGGGNN